MLPQLERFKVHHPDMHVSLDKGGRSRSWLDCLEHFLDVNTLPCLTQLIVPSRWLTGAVIFTDNRRPAVCNEAVSSDEASLPEASRGFLSYLRHKRPALHVNGWANRDPLWGY